MIPVGARANKLGFMFGTFKGDVSIEGIADNCVAPSSAPSPSFNKPLKSPTKGIFISSSESIKI
jgi:hypothetical protein